jgi:hypothetical protein
MSNPKILPDRALERQISQDDSFALAQWKAGDPDVPMATGSRISGHSSCGTGRYLSTFLLTGQVAHEVRLQSGWGGCDTGKILKRGIGDPLAGVTVAVWIVDARHRFAQFSIIQ